MNICLLCREYPPADGGGIGAYMHRYAHALARSGCRVFVITAAAGREPETRIDGNDDHHVTVIEIPVAVDSRWIGPSHDASDAQASAFHALGPTSLFAMAADAHLPALHATHHFDVVESPETGSSLWFILNGRRSGLAWNEPDSPVFVTHVFSPSEWIEQENRCPATSRGELALRWMEGDAARWSDAVVCSSEDLAGWAEQCWSLETGSVQLFPPPIANMSSHSRDTRLPTAKRLLYVGRLEPRKGVDILLAAFARACDQVGDLHLDLVGQDMIDPRTGEHFGQRSVEQIIPRELRSRVHLTGPLSGLDLNRARHGAIAAIVPGAWDNYPYTCVEAMHAGLPIIGARSGGVAQLVRDDVDGILFEPHDIDACASAIIRIATMSDDEIREMGQHASERVGDVCDNHAIVADRLEHYETLMNTREPSSRSVFEEGDIVLINAAELDNSERLVSAVQHGLDFAFGWSRTAAPPGVHVSLTPTPDSVAVFGGPHGPIAVSRQTLIEAGEEGLIEEPRCSDPKSLIMLLISRGFKGAVIPDVITEGTALTHRREDFAFDPLAPVVAAWNAAVQTPIGRRGMTWRQRAEAAEGELAQLRASRSMKIATGIYHLSRVVRPGTGRS